MSYLRIHVDENNRHRVKEFLSKLGCEITDETVYDSNKKESSDISPTFLFGKWKDTKLNPVTFRKKLWLRKKQ